MAVGVACMTTEQRRVRSAYVPVVIGGKLAFHYDPTRHVVQWHSRGETHYIDLAALDDKAGQSEQQGKADGAD